MRGGRICGHNKIRIEAHNPSEPLELGRQRPSRRSWCRYRRLLVAASLCLASHMLTRATSWKHVPDFPLTKIHLHHFFDHPSCTTFLEGKV